jgi:shikimate dehydrogenase
MIKLFGLIGNPLNHSFSQDYFNHKFHSEKITDCKYKLFQLNDISEISQLLADHPNLMGLNVTIPYKKQVVPFLNQLNPEAADTGAVNCIKIIRENGKHLLVGYNTDIYGFEQSLKPMLKFWHKKAIILGTGGGSAAVAHVLKTLNIKFIMVSRNPILMEHISYQSLNKKLLEENLLIVNTTPVGMFPETGQKPAIPYEWLTEKNLLYDLIYNPEETLFLKKGKEMGANIKNGFQMLQLQAEKSWEIWQS